MKHSFFNIQSYWQSFNLVSLLLLPLSWLFCFIAWLRKLVYQKLINKTQPYPCPIIVIGNIYVGGTGKTPFLIELVNYYKNQGYKVGVISRGYKAKHPLLAKGKSVLLNSEMTVPEQGDEPALIVNKTQVPVVIGSNRNQSIELLLAETDTNLIFSDDGLQHYAMQRNIEICVVDEVSQFGNKLCLPAGPLREKVSRLKEVDFVVYKLIKPSLNNEYSFNFSIKQCYHLFNYQHKNLADFKSTTVHAVTGIGNPLHFFNQLRALDIKVNEHRFPDHHSFKFEDLDYNDQFPILMTEKDAVKCKNYKDKEIWVVRLEINISKLFLHDLTDKINRISDKYYG